MALSIAFIVLFAPFMSSRRNVSCVLESTIDPCGLSFLRLKLLSWIFASIYIATHHPSSHSILSRVARKSAMDMLYLVFGFCHFHSTSSFVSFKVHDSPRNCIQPYLGGSGHRFLIQIIFYQLRFFGGSEIWSFFLLS